MIVKEVSAQETYPIRKNVLRNNIPLTEKMEGDFDSLTFHLGAFIEGKLVGVATFMKRENKIVHGIQYQLRGMATNQDVRYRGIGKALLHYAESMLKKRNVRVLWCNARILALPFYENMGFVSVGEGFDIKFIGTHFVMYKKLT